LKKDIVHFMGEGMSSIQGCIIDDRRGAKSLVQPSAISQQNN